MLIADLHEGFSIKLFFRLFVHQCLLFYLCPLSVSICIFSSLLLLHTHTHTHTHLFNPSLFSLNFCLSCVVSFSLFNLPLYVKISLLFQGLRIFLVQRKALLLVFWNISNSLSHNILYASLFSYKIILSEWAHSYP